MSGQSSPTTVASTTQTRLFCIGASVNFWTLAMSQAQWPMWASVGIGAALILLAVVWPLVSRLSPKSSSWINQFIGKPMGWMIGLAIVIAALLFLDFSA